jgi:hypothetical protein
MELILPAKLHVIVIEVRVDEEHGKITLILQPKNISRKPEDLFNMNYQPLEEDNGNS